MSDNIEQNNEKKLTLQPKAMLGIRKTIETSTIDAGRHSSTVVTVVKKKKFIVPSQAGSLSSKIGAVDGDLSPMNAKLAVLRRANEIDAVEKVRKEELEKARSRGRSSYQSQVDEEDVPNSAASEGPENKATLDTLAVLQEEIASQIEEEKSHTVTQVTESEGDKLHKVATASANDDEDEESKRNKHNKSKLVEVKPVKSKFEAPRRAQTKVLRTNISEDEESGRVRSLASIRRAREKSRRHHLSQEDREKIIREVVIPEVITVQELSNRMSERGSVVIRELMKLGMIATPSQTIDAETAEIVVTSLGHKAKVVSASDIENVLGFQDEDQHLCARAPVVTVMGHVDHGKTSLLDAIKQTDIAAGEAGGITQHIGAYRIQTSQDHFITFIDTPGHEAFTAMRARGAKATDIVVLVVAADDGIMAQTIEAISHAKAAEVPIIVAVNKIDKPGADPEKVKSELLSHGLVPEEFGGDIMVINVSAKNRTNLDKLEEAILFQAEMLGLRSNPDAQASGVVIESRVDKGKGVVTTLLVQRGTLRVGDLVLAGTCYGKVKAQIDDKGRAIIEATPSVPVEVLGLDEAPEAGDSFHVVTAEKQAREISEYRRKLSQELRVVSEKRGNTLEDLFGHSKIKVLPLIIKADVNGSIEAITGSFKKFENEEVRVKIVHEGVGGITESDVILANATKALVLGFNVRANQQAVAFASKEKVDIRYYSIIYNLIDDVKLMLSGMLSPIIREEYIGSVDVRQVFNITKVGKIAGCMVTSGIIKRGAGVRLIRDDVVIHEGKLKTLRRFKDDVKEVRESFECGIAFENYTDIKDGDRLEVFELIEEKKSL